MKYFYSFDVFDTVLTRTVTDPKDVFVLISQKLKDSTFGFNSSLIESFWGARVLAEFVARRQTVHEDVGIYDIYNIVKILFELDNCQVEKLVEVELMVERSVLVPVDGAGEMLSSLRDSGRGLLFVSDMYLPKLFIQEILEQYGLFDSGDKLYVSGEVGQTKGSGGLFTYVLDDLGITASELVHYGDHPESDGAVPTRLGIRLLKENSHRFRHCKELRALKVKIYYALQLVKAAWQLRGLVRV